MSDDLERILRKLRDRFPDPHPTLFDQVRAALAVRGSEVGAGWERRGRPGRGGLLSAVAALLVGSGVGFGLGHSFAPRPGVAAAAPSFGVGFLPAAGWSVVQRGLGTGGGASSVAANVPLEANDLAAGGFPRETVASLPPNGVVISATLYANGIHPGWQLPRLRLPLHLTEAAVQPPRPQRASYRILANVNGQDLDIRIVFGATVPPASATAEADRELSRLVVRTAPTVTIDARPRVAEAQVTKITLFGRVSGAVGDDHVRIEARECGFAFFSLLAGADPTEAGAWSAVVGAELQTVYRAKWKNDASDEVRVAVRPRMWLLHEAGERFTLSVQARNYFKGKKVSIQKFDEVTGRWTTVRSVVLRRLNTQFFRGGSITSVRLRLPRATLLRAVLPKSQVGRCYAPGVSNVVRG